MAVIAVTGDIGAGKSTVSRLLAQKFNCEVYDADEIVKNLWSSEEVKNSALSHWGKKILDEKGNIIKSKISELIFTNKNDWEFCNNLIHPLVMAELKSKSENSKTQNIILEIPLLFEAGKNDWIDKIVYVSADFEIRAERCRLQRGWNIEELKRREKFLLSKSEKILKSDYVIYNDKSIKETGEEINEIQRSTRTKIN